MHTDHPFTEKQDVFQLPDFAAGPYSVICDFDGTVTPFDVTDAILAGLNDEYIQSKGKGGKAAPATAEESETK